MSDPGEVRLERRGEVAWVTFDRPSALNAMTFAMYERLGQVSAEIDADPSVRAVVLTGAGEAFVAGTDISQFRDFRTELQALDYEAKMDRILGALEGLRVPTIAAIRGPAVGGGAAIAAACDIRIGAPSARFGVPIARTLGNVLSLNNVLRLVTLVGVARVKEILFTARLLDAAEMKQAGLLAEVTASDEALPARAEELARQIASFAPLTLRATKEQLRRIRERMRPEEGADLILLCYMSEDFREGVRAFMEKRRPVWKGE
ncbi:MAG: enoyl-CoA hydratase [Chloroflexi bacterium]|nr:enoyl-CoA hydratase [Chloroflexota bacterium]